jgi:ubiquinone/menaquinone biosynthesis C-methylase UbiE
MKDKEVYFDIAKYYDKLYSFKDYQKEVDDIVKLIKQYKKSDGTLLLDVGCGTGGHFEFLQEQFVCTGLDISESMLVYAKQKFPDIDFIQDDMAEMNLDGKYDVILCLFSSIGYILTEDKLQKTINNFSNHLKPGGIVIIEPWLTKDIYRTGLAHMTVYDGEDMKIARVNISELKDDIISYFDMHYLIAEHHKPVVHLVDHHELAMFPHELILDYMKQSGLITHKITEDIFTSRGLLLGIKK